jgi:putative ABC transport system permease protein
MFKTTLKTLLARKFRLVTTGFAVLLGVAFVAGTLVLTSTVSSTFDNLFSDVFKGTDAYVRAVEPFKADGQGGPINTRPRIDAALLDTVAKAPGVKTAEGSVFGFAQVIGADGKAIGNPGQGAPTFGGNWSSVPGLNSYHLIQGKAPATDDQVVIDNHSAKEGKLHVGDQAKILTKAGAIPVHVVGIAKFGKYDSAGGSTTVSFTMAAAQKYIAEPGKFDGVAVVAQDGVSQSQVRADIAKVIPKGTEAITGATLTKENQDQVAQFIGIFRNFMLAFALIALFVGSFIIYNTFSILVAQRTREMALLRAIGASRRQVTLSLLLEALVVGSIAAVLGLFAGIGVAVGLKALLTGFGFELPANGLTVSSSTVITSLLLGILVSVFASWFPARRGAKVPPIAAMRDVAIENSGRPRLRVGIGAVITLAGVVALFSGLFGNASNPLALVGMGAVLTLLGVTALGPLAAKPVSGLLGRPVAATRGMSGVLARENAMRNPRRTSTTASALLIGVALVGFITIFASSAKASIDKIFNDQFTGDFVMNTDTFGFGGVSPKMADELRQQPGIAAVSALRTTSAQFDGKGVLLQALDAKEMGQIADIGVEQGNLSDLDAHSVAVLDTNAKDNGWKLGSDVAVRFPDSGVQQLTVKVIYKNKELATSYFVDTSVFDANVHDQYDSIVFAKLDKGTSVDQARPAIEQVTKQYANVKVQDRAEFIKEQAGQINQTLAFIYVLLFLAIIIALFGIANTLALSIVERTRELGLLRAVGMTRKQLKSMVRWEAVLIALFGTVGGLGVGTFFGWAMIRALADEGFKVFNLPIFSLAIIAVLAGLFGVLAAVVPARRASKLNVLAAIAAD